MMKNIKNKKVFFPLLILFFIIVIGATIAYFQSTTSFENEFNYGVYDVYSSEVFESPDNWKPGEEIPKTITTKNEGTIPAAVRMKFEEKWEDSEGNDITNQIRYNPVYFIYNEDAFDDWIPNFDFDDMYIYYSHALMPGEETSSLLSAVVLDSDLNDVVCTGNGNTKTCESFNPVVGGKYTLTITKETVQYDAYDKVWPNVPSLVQPESFATDDWNTIATAIRFRMLDKYHVGDEKIINVGKFGDQIVRISNMSIPTECYRNDFSQTACGFVIEFVSSIRSDPFISRGYEHSNVGGWESSYARGLLNSTNIDGFDFSNGGLFNELPTDLKKIIIDTEVISSHGSSDSSNYVTSDKLYLLSTHEIMEDGDDNPNSGINYYDTSYNNTRQLDYYNERGITGLDYSKYGYADYDRWTRSVYGGDSRCAYAIGGYSGNYTHCYRPFVSSSDFGLYPAFRIG